jgi:hypothetical protein
MRILCFGSSLALLMISNAGFAQSYSIDWHKISGGGGASAGGVYSVSGTIGQPEAGAIMSGGSYSVTGGFWALIRTVPSPGLPPLAITISGNTAIVSWPNTGNYLLQQKSSLTSGSWLNSGHPVSTLNGTNSITIISPAGTLFFRLNQ